MSIITLTTDFGYRDPFVGEMKGVILSINPKATIVDISHEIAAQNVFEASLAIAQSYRFFPKGTIHVIVVDPKVGTNRKILCVKTNEAYYLAPDNGVLSFILENEKPFTIRSIENQAFMRDEVSFTFHGRDKFAPVAAHLSKSDIFEKVGPKISTFETLEWPKPHFKTDHVEGEVIHVDRFGNLMTNLRAKEIEKKFKPEEVSIGRLKITKWVNSYGEGRDRELVVLINSAGFIEIAATNDSAAALSSANVGSKVTCV